MSGQKKVLFENIAMTAAITLQIQEVLCIKYSKIITRGSTYELQEAVTETKEIKTHVSLPAS